MTIRSPTNGSALPWPYWWSSSAGFIPILNPINAIKDVSTSDKVCADSAMSALLPENVPTTKLKIVRKILPVIAMVEAFLPIFSRRLS